MTRPRLLRSRGPRRRIRAIVLGAGLGLIVAGTATAEPFRPASDDEVLAVLPARRTDPAARELAALREAARAAPQDPARALAAARAAVRQARALGDPRYLGQAQAAIGPWWADPSPPADIQVMRAVINQYGQRFDAALADLDAVVRRDPGHAEAWSWLATVHLVRQELDDATRACTALAPRVTPLQAVACRSAIDALTGRAGPAAAALRAALDAEPQADPSLRLRALAQLGQIETQRGNLPAAEAAFEAALALGLDDVALRAAHADLLLAQGRPQEVLVQLRNGADADLLLLRLAIAAQAAGSPLATRYADDLAARFAAARQRGDSTHQREEARFELVLRHRPQAALALAQAQYARRRELADAQLLLESALAAGQPAAAQPVLRWMRATGVESPALHDLARRLESPR